MVDKMGYAVLIIDDEVVLAKSIQKYLTRHDYDARVAASAKEAALLMDEFQPDVVLVDYLLPDGTGLEILRSMSQSFPGAKYVFMTGHGSIEVAVQAMKEGASEFISKPVVLEELRLLLERVAGLEKKEKSLAYFRNKQESKGGLDAILGNSAPIAELKSQISSLVDAEASMGGEAPPPVLIVGETGTGKQLVARALHFDGSRSSGPFIELNCAALPEQLVESELFGYERGAFTDAKDRKAGLIESADGGTLFLDEVGELPLSVQAKFLKTLEEQTVRRLGQRARQAGFSAHCCRNQSGLASNDCRRKVSLGSVFPPADAGTSRATFARQAKRCAFSGQSLPGPEGSKVQAVRSQIL